MRMYIFFEGVLGGFMVLPALSVVLINCVLSCGPREGGWFSGLAGTTYAKKNGTRYNKAGYTALSRS